MAILTPKGARAPHQLKGRRNVRVSHDRRGCGTDDIEVLRNELLQVIKNSITPIGSITASCVDLSNKGFILCDGSAVSRTDYAELFTKVGTTFGSGDGSTTFNIPDIRDRFIQGANENLGTYKEAGLPNITGNATVVTDNATGFSPTRAFINAGTPRDRGWTGNNGDEIRKLGFDASKGETRTDGTLKTDDEHHVYGSSDTVQPPAVCLYYFIKAKHL